MKFYKNLKGVTDSGMTVVLGLCANVHQLPDVKWSDAVLI